MILAFSLTLVACTTPIPSTATAFPRTTLPILPAASPTKTPMLTLTPPNTLVTPVPAPTLTGEEKDRFLESMLETNGGCELPCWWGDMIVPGKTTLEEAKSFFSAKGISPLVDPGIVNATFQVPYTDAMQSWEYNARITVAVQGNGLVQSVEMMGDVYPGNATLRFTRAWGKHYAWDHVLTSLGTPSQVLVLISPANYAESADYSLTLVYEGLGILINYVGSAEEVSTSKLRACPRFDQVTGIMLRLVPSDEGDSLIGPKAQAFTLEETTGMSLQTFYETFSISDEVACLDQEIKP